MAKPKENQPSATYQTEDVIQQLSNVQLTENQLATQPRDLIQQLIRTNATSQQLVVDLQAQQHACPFEIELPIFKGRYGIDNARKFAFQIKQACTASGVTNNNQIMAIAACQLRGTASDWWFGYTLQHKGNTDSMQADDFFRLLEENYPPPSALYLCEKLIRVKQTKDIHDYIYRFGLIAYQLSEMSEAEKVSLFINGLRDPQTRLVLQMTSWKSLNHVFTAAARSNKKSAM